MAYKTIAEMPKKIEGGPIMAPTDVVQMLNEARQRYHSEVLADATIAVVFVQTVTDRGRPVSGKAAKVPEVHRLLSGYDFVITLSWQQWRTMSEEARFAALDHELTHCYMDENGRPQIRPHDLEIFADVAVRHPRHFQGAAVCLDVARQLEIEFDKSAQAETKAAS